ncbi:MAG: AAA family ATPase [Acidaminobacter sp.]|uniref:ATP-binding protein n=1 Tax=Acidaminobacter sp. TaxID=1872102 RepID=UPI0013836E51|nr:ATP-binding protein [Acidaminobacter sp.]MZQ96274.1 AAA family ATPase [Acidaminobacter sp.]
MKIDELSNGILSKDSKTDHFETRRSDNQELTFIQAEGIFEKSQIRMDDELKRSMGIINDEGDFTNLGLLISDQNCYSITAAFIQGGSSLICKFREEFTGSILKQCYALYDYVDQFNRTRSEIEGLYRHDFRDYPLEAIREALMNAVVHRDYAFNGSTLIKIFEDRIEFLTFGGLPIGLTSSDLKFGISVPRNLRLLDVFRRLNLADSVGIGFKKIERCYQGERIQPSVDVTENVFMLTLPNLNFDREHPQIHSESYVRETEDLSEIERSIAEFIGSKYEVSRKELETSFGLSQSRAVRTLNGLIDKGLIHSRGNGKNTVYVSKSKKW